MLERWGETGERESRAALHRARARLAEVRGEPVAPASGREPSRHASAAVRRALHGRRAAARDDRAARPPYYLWRTKGTSGAAAGRGLDGMIDRVDDPGSSCASWSWTARPRARTPSRSRGVGGSSSAAACSSPPARPPGRAARERPALPCEDAPPRACRRARMRIGRVAALALLPATCGRTAAGVATGTMPAAPPATLRRTAARSAFSPAPPSRGARSGASTGAPGAPGVGVTARRYSPSVENSTIRSSAVPICSLNLGNMRS